MNEFVRKAMELAEEFARQSQWLGYYDHDGMAHKQTSVVVDAARSALLAHLEGGEQKWISVKDRLPEPMTMVLAAFEMDRPGDWRIKCASYEPLCIEFSIINQKGWRIFGGGWTPSHWCPLPATPTEEASK